MELLIYLGFAAVIGGIVVVCLLVDGDKRRRRAQYDRDMAAWRQTVYLRQIAEQGQQAPRQDSST